jgi:hypothetical protein
MFMTLLHFYKPREIERPDLQATELPARWRYTTHRQCHWAMLRANRAE